MTMKRFLISFILIAFVTVSCAGPSKVGWTRPDFDANEFNKDQEECIVSIDKDLSSQDFAKGLKECLAKKNYKYYQAEAKNCKYQWTKPDFNQEAFEKDRWECMNSIDKSLVSEAFGNALDECLGKKGYTYHQVEMEPKGDKSSTAQKVLFGVGYISLGAALLALMVLAAAVGGAGGALGGLGH
jgi:hypothetical protein